VIAPGYQYDIAGPVVDITISSQNGSWNSANDWSYSNWDSAYVSVDRQYAPNIPMYEGDTLLSGNEPGSGGTSAPTAAPTPTTTPAGSVLMRDVDDNGTVTIVDALLVARYYVGLNPANFNPEASDTNCDGSTDIVDALLIAQYYVGLITEYC
jgi:endoglucanase